MADQTYSATDFLPAVSLSQARALKIPLFIEAIVAGFPSPAQDYVEQALDLNKLCIKHPAATFFVRVKGESMLDAGIYPDDILVVDRALQARHGDVVIACLHGELTVKRLHTRPSLRLLACNPAYPPIDIPEAAELDIFGVVTYAIHNLSQTPAPR